jgi:hypothetical protein
MSVGTRRLAAAQRTAVGKAPSRARRLGAWIVIVPTLALFSFSVVAGAAGFAGKPDLAAAAAKVVPAKAKDDGNLVVVQARDLLGRKKEICWISKAQLARVSAVYRTTTSTITVEGTQYTVVTVYGANEHDLKVMLGTFTTKCQLVHVAKVFFLPFDPNLS